MMVPFVADHVPGGTERRNFSDAMSLATIPGNQVYFTVVGERGSIPKSSDGVRLVRLHDEGKEVATCAPRQWQKSVMERMDLFLSKVDIDVVQYGCNSHFWLAKQLLIKYRIPTNIFIGNYLSGNLMYDTGRCGDLYKLKENGATYTFNTETCSVNFHKQIDKMVDSLIQRNEVPKYLTKHLKSSQTRNLTSHTNKNNMGWGAVGNYSLKNVVEPDDQPYAIIAARVDPVKRLHKFVNVNFPLRVYVKNRKSDKGGYGARLLANMKKNPNITVFEDRSYSEIMEGFKGASLALISWPDETFGLTAFEAASFGVPCAVFRKTPDDLNATEEFLSRLSNEDSPRVVYNMSYDSKSWKSKLEKAFNHSLKRTKEDRLALAKECKSVYSFDAYVQERYSMLLEAMQMMAGNS